MYNREINRYIDRFGRKTRGSENERGRNRECTRERERMLDGYVDCAYKIAERCNE